MFVGRCCEHATAEVRSTTMESSACWLLPGKMLKFSAMWSKIYSRKRNVSEYSHTRGTVCPYRYIIHMPQHASK